MTTIRTAFATIFCRRSKSETGPGGVPVRFPRLAKWLTVCSWLNLAMVVGSWVLFRLAGDRWWLATVLLYGPRWVYALPLIVLLPTSLLLKRRCLYLLLTSGLIVLFPLMGFVVSLGPFRGAPTGNVIRVLNCNVDGGSMNDQAMAMLISDTRPDIIALQEYSRHSTLAPVLSRLGWHIHESGGLFLASQFPIVSAKPIPTVEGWRTLACIYELQTSTGKMHFINLHLETARKGLESVLQGRRSQIQPIIKNTRRRWQESDQVRKLISSLNEPIIVCGDFNLPTDSSIFREFWGEFDDAFSGAGLGVGNTKFTRRWGIRIDHLLTKGAWKAWHCSVGPDVGSDHRPLVTELVASVGQVK